MLMSAFAVLVGADNVKCRLLCARARTHKLLTWTRCSLPAGSLNTMMYTMVTRRGAASNHACFLTKASPIHAFTLHHGYVPCCFILL